MDVTWIIGGAAIVALLVCVARPDIVARAKSFVIRPRKGGGGGEEN